MSHATERADRFLELHRRGEPLLLANVWDAGSARLLDSMPIFADAASIRRAATARGMTTLREDGAEKVLAGMTSIEEILRVTQEDLLI